MPDLNLLLSSNIQPATLAQKNEFAMLDFQTSGDSSDDVRSERRPVGAMAPTHHDHVKSPDKSHRTFKQGVCAMTALQLICFAATENPIMTATSSRPAALYRSVINPGISI
ncbi:hypothetical protein [Pseudomonas purpurea]|uniref:hypothetical protein n=1 Tax=Pseudomonas purpurea TaxID=3136737 RepID=UPI003266653B